MVAAVFSFGGIAASAVEFARILFFVFLIVTVVTLILGALRRGATGRLCFGAQSCRAPEPCTSIPSTATGSPRRTYLTVSAAPCR
jgi:uncharacterized membrane protein YtjA (UPF0391 family)